MRVIVCGGREFDDESAVRREFDALREGHGSAVTIVHGAQRKWDQDKRRYVGADHHAAMLAPQYGFGVEPHPADWNRLGRAAGPIRNQEMADAGADLCLAFPGGSGTASMKSRARSAGIEVYEVAA